MVDILDIVDSPGRSFLADLSRSYTHIYIYMIRWATRWMFRSLTFRVVLLSTPFVVVSILVLFLPTVS